VSSTADDPPAATGSLKEPDGREVILTQDYGSISLVYGGTAVTSPRVYFYLCAWLSLLSS
jgi:hypothetical protein